MADLIFIATLVAFFALMDVLVRVCERVIGKEEAVGTGPAAGDTTATTPEEVPA